MSMLMNEKAWKKFIEKLAKANDLTIGEILHSQRNGPVNLDEELRLLEDTLLYDSAWFLCGESTGNIGIPNNTTVKVINGRAEKFKDFSMDFYEIQTTVIVKITEGKYKFKIKVSEEKWKRLLNFHATPFQDEGEYEGISELFDEIGPFD